MTGRLGRVVVSSPAMQPPSGAPSLVPLPPPVPSPPGDRRAPASTPPPPFGPPPLSTPTDQSEPVQSDDDRSGPIASIVAVMARLIGWGTTAGVGAVMATQGVGWDGNRLVATLQALTPYGLPPVVAALVLAVWRRWLPLAVVSGLVAVGGFVLLIPLVVTADQPAADPGAEEVRIASINLLFANPRIDEVGDLLDEIRPDVIVFSEYTADHQFELLEHPIADQFPHRVERDGLFSGGMAVWSRFPIDENARPNTVNRTIDSTISAPDGPIRLFAVHPPTPVFDFEGWRAELDAIGDAAERADANTIVVGDFNASYWHPAFRDLTDRGLTDAHIANGSGFSTSWPTDSKIPPFVRLDHALTRSGLVPTDVSDFHVPGSDHTGFVVTVTPAR